ncbi:MAG TPA: serine hydrolase domain-containing protein [Hymenobacter sp.]|jgi:CubicO group peptidase (beta-lactamase class C family)|uniref:serine hydrolase domain-containing protein n=1 Tax=Hymenobacter sp. TaxID=1898978 RepID=UPI002EDBB193
MFKLLLPAAALAIASLLAGPPAHAQAPAFTSYAQFNDTLVARYNRGDFAGIEGLGSPALRKIEPLGNMVPYLTNIKEKTGRISSATVLAVRGARHEFEWKGEKQNLRVSLTSPAPGVIDDYYISDFIAQPAGARRTTPVLTDNKQKTALDQAVHRAAALYMQHPNAAGMSVGIYQQGKTYFYNYGEVEKGTGRLPTSATYYDLGSVAKTFVGTLLAQAVLDKKVKLTDDIRQYLPGQYPNLEVEGRAIQILDLANHRGGLPGPSHVYIPATKTRFDQLNQTEKVAYYNKYTADSLLTDLRATKLRTKPGTVYNYSGFGMLVLQLILERVYQQPYEQLATKFVQTRFGMFDTKRVLTPAETKRFATGYKNNGEAFSRVNYTGFWGGPTMCSTAADLMKYAQANLAEREPAVRLAHQRTTGKAPEFGNGLGWRLDADADGHSRIQHSGSSPGFNTWFSVYPEQDFGIVILVNENVNQTRLTEMEELLKQEMPKPAATKKQPARAAAGGAGGR